jgi:alkyl hydroperoxide reductase subunit AhpF
MAGLQGSGKTTTTAKIARYFQKKGLRVGVICADTFRPGALDQLTTLCNRINVPCYGEQNQTDALTIVRQGFSTLQQSEVVIIDVNSVMIYQRKGGELLLLNRIAGEKIDKYISVDIADINENGIPEISGTKRASERCPWCWIEDFSGRNVGAIGGGIIHVPILGYFLHFPVHVATATSHFVLAIMALTGTVKRIEDPLHVVHHKFNMCSH